MDIEKLVSQAAKEAAVIVMNKLDNRELSGKKVGNDKSAFKKTETLLYNYNNFKSAIINKTELIDCIKEKDLQPINRSAKNPPPACETKEKKSRIYTLERSIALTRYYVQEIEASLDSIKDDPYFDIIRLKYFENLLAEDVADRLFVDVSTINRNKRRLIDMLKIRLFSDDVINGMVN